MIIVACHSRLRAFVAGICSFEHILHDKNVVIWSDNSGAEHAARKGGANAVFPLHVQSPAFFCSRHNKVVRPLPDCECNLEAVGRARHRRMV